MNDRPLRLFFCFVLIALALTGCSDDDSDGPAEFRRPDGTVGVDFSVDDTANQTYTAGDGLAWKGSFGFDSKTRVLAYDPGWSGPCRCSGTMALGR